MVVKGSQLVGILIFILVVAAGEYFFKDLSPNMPLYSGAATSLGFVGVVAIATIVYSVTVIPTSVILLKRKNREYFRLQSIYWRAIILFNWAIIGSCSLFVIISISYDLINKMFQALF